MVHSLGFDTLPSDVAVAVAVERLDAYVLISVIDISLNKNKLI